MLVRQELESPLSKSRDGASWWRGVCRTAALSPDKQLICKSPENTRASCGSSEMKTSRRLFKQQIKSSLSLTLGEPWRPSLERAQMPPVLRVKL
ncbi:unnamed protein product [Pleuronectes platessa]|uniref:Uncharacterized protein n=1 Tax=Pleuronectes platessa TaxID=8262 RepID=A0A9N7TM95_PLEPL|nr:unnamed protein product [Pleuronectes platessa]